MAARTSTTTTNLEDVWSDLETGLNDVYKRTHMLPARYMELYTHVFNFCTSVTASPSVALNNQPRNANTNRKNNRSLNGSAPTTADFMGVELYSKLKKFITEYVLDVQKKGEDHSGEELLKFYTREWSEFRFSSKVVDGIFAYLNRHWIKREIDEGNDEICPIYTLALIVWRDELFKSMNTRITQAVLDLIRRERGGETIPRNLISGVVDSYVELGIDNNSDDSAPTTRNGAPVQQAQEPSSLSVYRVHFETVFLSETDTFYSTESQIYMEKNSLTEYMKRVETRLDEEHSRCDFYLHKSTQGKLAKCLERVLIQSQLVTFQNEFGNLLDNRKDEDLARMYKLCERVENGLENLRSALERHICKEGLTAVEQVAEQASQDAKLYVTTVLQVHNRYAVLVEQAFKNEPGFMQSLDKAATTFINKNAVTVKNNVTSCTKCPELLSKYCDQLLRKSNKMPEDSELENLLCQVMIVFKYIEDKDVFSKFYTKMFSKRLIADVSASEEAEMSFINKLKQSCGFEYTNRMSKMINDVQISKETCTAFRTHQAEKSKGGKDLDMSILVLSTGSWPALPTTNFLLPTQLSKCMEEFNAYYDTKHNGRKLTWVHANSRGELACSAFSSKKIFTTTTAQMAILMMYNDALEYTVGAMSNGLQMDKKTLTGNVMSLIKNEVLKGTEPPGAGEFEDDQVISLNMSYTNKKVKVDLSKLALRVDPKQETEAVAKNVDEDRKSVINACIVRIMKTRKSLSHQLLMSEVLSQLSSRFKPKVELVKRCIGQLIEKEYLKRSEDNRDTYEYVA